MYFIFHFAYIRYILLIIVDFRMFIFVTYVRLTLRLELGLRASNESLFALDVIIMQLRGYLLVQNDYDRI